MRLYFFAKKIKKIVAYQIDTELFFEVLLGKKNEQNGLFCSYNWYKFVILCKKIYIRFNM
jgi:hypothetical protein